jgi:hypothetical protein
MALDGVIGPPNGATVTSNVEGLGNPDTVNAT